MRKREKSKFKRITMKHDKRRPFCGSHLNGPFFYTHRKINKMTKSSQKLLISSQNIHNNFIHEILKKNIENNIIVKM